MTEFEQKMLEEAQKQTKSLSSIKTTALAIFVFTCLIFGVILGM